jgi:RNA-directed DNA polymerase
MRRESHVRFCESVGVKLPHATHPNVYVRRRRAGERVMALLRRLYGKLRLTVNETKSAVTSVFGRKFLGYSFWVAPGGAIKRKVAVKPLH